MENNGFVIGKTNTRELNIISQEKAYIQSEYLIIKDINLNDIPCEVIETSIIPFAHDSVLPEGCVTNFIEKLNLDINSPCYLAKVKILKDIAYPIMPSTKVVRASFNQIAPIISSAKVGDSMTVGIIKGTELSQDELPEEMKNIAPLWSKGSAVNQCGVPFMVNHHLFREYPHIGLFGSSGSGKSFALRVLLEELMKLGVPGIAFDPHYELRFEGLMDGLEKKFDFNFKDCYEEFVIGENVGINFKELNYSELVSLFDFGESLTEAQKNALEAIYEKGDTFSHLMNKINSLKEAFNKEELRKNSYGRKKTEETELTVLESELYQKLKHKVSGSASLQALAWKCTSLDNTQIFCADTTSVQTAIKKGKFAIIRGDISRLQMISSYLMRKLYKARRTYVDNNGEFFPPFFSIFDEAHNFAPSEGRNLPTRSILRKIGQEARKYGVFLGLCTQRPRSLDTTLLAQLNTKFIFRLTDKQDMEVAKVEGNLTDNQVITLPDLPSGNCFVSSATLNKTYPVLFRTTFSKAPNVSDPFEELTNLRKNSNEEMFEILKKYLPLTTIGLGKILPNLKADIGKQISIKDATDILNDLVSSGQIKFEKSPVGSRYFI